ncbi:ABC transporter ATP-binding protein/permease [Siccirubricoccus sp. KC 17139]|uniref:ABC transporter ATP-binding protein/permease n=1 Tax=Siccirubricoccus soli TaxID=2899147 RepID=A0ABT1D0V5_9PROT|nr:SbmA/BacA-like family transporter [Siccirubricoccus soli]MCO6414660.1 ABC transporter ATP-binding protein/permease [Siccirubricoccus soli]MCP2680790.1 ABC transporter ATP-binding protein/permease [Siccirubricoccus soli]
MSDPHEEDLPPPLQEDSFRRAFHRFALRYFFGRSGMRPRLLSFGLILAIIAQVALLVRLNVWNADLFDALDRRATEHLLWQAGLFLLLVAGMMVANAVQLQLKRDLQWQWRCWLTRHLTANWLSQGRHYALSQLDTEHASNPDGRIAEDIRITTESAIELASTFLTALLALFSFLSVLWVLSGIVEIPLPGTETVIPVPGHMVVLALLYSAGGNTVALLLGRPLVRATDLRQGHEASFRFALSRARECSEALAMAHAEPRERGRLNGLIALIGEVWQEQTRTLRSLILFSVGYGQIAPVLPLLVATPRYLAGAVTLGGLVQMSQAFQQVTASLSWPVDNAQRMAEWRASAERVLALRAAIATLGESARPNLYGEPVEEGGIVLESLVVRTPDGRAATPVLNERFAAGEGVHLLGDPHATALLCKAIAGHWRWGEGNIRLGPGVVPVIRIANPWLPEVPLQELLCGPGAGDPELMAAALEAMGLEALKDKLTEAEAWDSTLPEGDRQRLMLAALLVRRPEVVVLEHPLRALAPEVQEELFGKLRQALPEAVLLVSGPLPKPLPGFARELHLDPADAGPSRPVVVPRQGRIAAWLQKRFQPAG